MEILSISSKELVPLIKETLSEGNELNLLVTGTSMNPFIGDNRDRVLLTSVSNIGINKGEIVFIQRNNQEYVLHRVLKILPNEKFLMNGDSQTWCEVVRNDQVFACVKTIYRKGRAIEHDNIFYIILTRLWMLLLPLRPLIFKLWKIFNNILIKTSSP